MISMLTSRTIRLLGVMCLGVGFGVDVYAQTTVAATTYTGTHAVTDPVSITTSGVVTVSATANVSFGSGGTITLGPGFSVALGGKFHAFSNTDGDGDGMPDYWESTQGLNPAVNDAGSDLDGDGLNNYSEYLLGTDVSGSGSNSSGGATIKLKIVQPND